MNEIRALQEVVDLTMRYKDHLTEADRDELVMIGAGLAMQVTDMEMHKSARNRMQTELDALRKEIMLYALLDNLDRHGKIAVTRDGPYGRYIAEHVKEGEGGTVDLNIDDLFAEHEIACKLAFINIEAISKTSLSVDAVRDGNYEMEYNINHVQPKDIEESTLIETEEKIFEHITDMDDSKVHIEGDCEGLYVYKIGTVYAYVLEPLTASIKWKK